MLRLGSRAILIYINMATTSELFVTPVFVIRIAHRLDPARYDLLTIRKPKIMLSIATDLP